MDLNRHDLGELRQAAEKALALESPYPRPTVVMDADKLLALLNELRDLQARRDGEQRLYDEETETTIRQQTEEIQKLHDELAKRMAPPFVDIGQ